MCDMNWHKCAACGVDIKCDIANRECASFNGYEDYCYQCEYMHEEQLREVERDERRKWEQEQWEREHTYE